MENGRPWLSPTMPNVLSAGRSPPHCGWEMSCPGPAVGSAAPAGAASSAGDQRREQQNEQCPAPVGIRSGRGIDTP